MGKQNLDNIIRNEHLALVTDFFENIRNTDTLRVSASELAIPVVDAEGTEKFVLIKISVPRGTRNGKGGYDPYDGYAMAEEYKLDMEAKANKKKKEEVAE